MNQAVATHTCVRWIDYARNRFRRDIIQSMANIFIYGGCVTRDTFERMKDRHTLKEYVARQSLLSAASKSTTLDARSTLTSAFQSRTVDADLRSSLFQSMRRHADDTDLMLVDFLSDRLGAFRMEDGSYITRSAELERSGRLGGRRPPFVKFGSDRHFVLWKNAFAKFIRTAEISGLLPKIVVLEATWAAFLESGDKTPMFRDFDANKGNEQYERYYSHVRAHGLKTVRIPDSLAVGSNQHKWGPAPYHYVDETYSWLIGQFESSLQ